MDLILPTTFKDRTKDNKYAKYEGMPKLSYSQITSWLEPEYRNEYIRGYFIGTPREGSIFTEFGSACGTFLESIGTKDPGAHEPYKHILSQSDRDILTANISFSDNQVYEDYIVINVDDLFIIEGYADRISYSRDNKNVIVEDFKTGSIQKKTSYYAGPDYNQTRLYAYAKELEGYNVHDCKVILLDRKGNGSEKHPLRLTGLVQEIETKYSLKAVGEFLEKAKRTAQDISENYQKFLKYFK